MGIVSWISTRVQYKKGNKSGKRKREHNNSIRSESANSQTNKKTNITEFFLFSIASWFECGKIKRECLRFCGYFFVCVCQWVCKCFRVSRCLYAHCTHTGQSHCVCAFCQSVGSQSNAVNTNVYTFTSDVWHKPKWELLWQPPLSQKNVRKKERARKWQSIVRVRWSNHEQHFTHPKMDNSINGVAKVSFHSMFT